MSRPSAHSRRTRSASGHAGFAAAVVFLGLCALLALPIAAQELDEDCVVSLLNRTAPVDAKGIWVLPNVPAGIGQVRLRATCVENGVTVGGQSDYFTVPADGVIRVDEIRFDGPAPVPERLTISASTTTLVEPAQVLPLTVLAFYPDGSSADVTSAAAGTNYVVSNPSVATISPDGELTAVASGAVIVSALNEGASGFLRLQVILSGDSDGDGIPDDVEVSLGLDPNDPVDALLDPDGDGLTNGDEVAFGTDPEDPDTDGDGLADGEEIDFTGTDPALFDTDGDDLSDGLEIATGSDPLDPASFNLAEALASLALRPEVFILNTNTVFPGEAFVALNAEGTLIDGNTIDLTSSARGTGFISSDLFVCNFGAEDGVIFGGAEGPCTITATNSDFTANAEGLVQEFSPRPVSSLDLPSYGNSVAVLGGWAFVAGGPGGLHVVDVSDRRDPRIATSLPLAGNANDIVLDGGLAYVAAGDAGLHLVDVSVPATPVLVGSVDTPGSAIALRVSSDLVYLADGPEGLQVVSVADPTLPTVLGSWDTPGQANGLAVDGGLAVVSTLTAPLEVIDVSTPSAPVGLATLSLAGTTYDVELLESNAYVATSSDLRVVDLSDPQLPVDRGAFGAGIWMIDLLAFGGDRIFTTQVEPSTRMPIFDLRSDPTTPFFAGILQFRQPGGVNGDPLHIAADDHYAYVTASTNSEVDSKPGTIGETRLLIGLHTALEEIQLEGQAPDVAVVIPDDGSEVAEGTPFPVAITATDDVAVLDVSLLVDGEEVGRDDSPPYSFLVDPPPAPASLRIGASARDFGGNQGEATEITVHVVEGVGVTTVVGTVETSAGDPVAGASALTSLGGEAVTATDGGFVIPELPSVTDSLVAFAAATLDATQFRGRSAPVPVVKNGTTNVGAIVLKPLGLPYPTPRSDVSLIRGSPVRHLAFDDLDGDGVPDIVASGDTGTLAFLPGRGDGSFGEALAVTNGVAPREVAVADLNLDGFQDLVSVNDETEGSDLRILLGQGDGTFLPPMVIALPINPISVAVGDVNLDLIPDLVAGGRLSADAWVLLGIGDGGFAAPVQVPLTTAPLRLRLADLDGDGRLDISALGQLGVAFGNGDGSFESAIELGTGTRPIRDHEVGDVDGNGLPDIVAVRERPFPGTGDHLAVFLSQGDRTFLEMEGSGAVSNPGNIELGDLDLDGVLDVVVIAEDAHSRTMAFPLLGDGSGLFEERAGVPIGVLSFFWEPFTVADFDLDGVPDLASGGGLGVSVFAGKGDGTFGTYLLGDRSFSLPVAEVGSVLAVTDLTGDGVPDLARGGTTSVGYFPRLADGQFGAEETFALAYTPIDLLATDLTGDGVAEIVSIGDPGSLKETVSIFRNLGDGTFADPPEELTTGLDLEEVIAADLTADGFPDLIVASSSFPGRVGVLVNDGAGTVGSPQLTSISDISNSVLHVAAGDFDQDGDLDVAATADSPNLHLLTNNGDGTLVVTQTIRLDQSGTALARRADVLVATDLNGDGVIDLTMGHFGGTRVGGWVSVLLGLGDGQFSAEERFPVGLVPRAIAPTDVDGDGALDLVVVNSNSHDVSVLNGVGDGTFSKERRFATPQRPEAVFLMDVNGDGVEDLAIGTRNNSTAITTGEMGILVHQ